MASLSWRLILVFQATAIVLLSTRIKNIAPDGRGGKDTIQELLTLDPEARVIVTSDYSHDPVMANYYPHGFRAAMPKPFSMQELSKAIEDAISPA